jgi:P27 family predicted phage terminase small subunit
MMARRGPKTKPTQLKVLSGTARKHRLNAHEPRPEAARPAVPDHLTTAAQLEWARVVEEIVTLGILTNLDRGALAAYCQAYGRWVTAETALARMAEKDAITEGLIIRTKSGNAIQNPLVGAANKAMADMMRYAAEFGLTPSARTRVSGAGRSDVEDPFAVFDCA